MHEDHEHTYTHSHPHSEEHDHHHHDHGDEHEHTHTYHHHHDHDEPGHTHEHEHEHHHHDHDHDHCHDHSHCHECGGCDPMDELKAMMKYMVGHNAAHARELAELAKALEQAGNHTAYEQVMAAVSDFEKGNLRLSATLASLEG